MRIWYRLGALAALLALVGCMGGVQPRPKYDVSRGLVLTARRTGEAPGVADPDLSLRGARMAATVAALAGWCERFAELTSDVDHVDFQIPFELQDPESPPPDLSNLRAYAADVHALNESLHLETRATESDTSGGVELWCQLHAGVELHSRGTVDELGGLADDAAWVQITEESGYHYPTTVEVVSGRLIAPDPAAAPLEYLTRLATSKSLQVAVRDLENGRAEATVSREFQRSGREARRR